MTSRESLDRDDEAEGCILLADEHRETEEEAEHDVAPQIVATDRERPGPQERRARPCVERVAVARHVGRVVRQRCAEEDRDRGVRGRPSSEQLHREPSPEQHGTTCREHARQEHEPLVPIRIAVERDVRAEHVADVRAGLRDPHQRRPNEGRPDGMRNLFMPVAIHRLNPRVAKVLEVVVEVPVEVECRRPRHQVQHVAVAAIEDGQVLTIAARRIRHARIVVILPVQPEQEHARGRDRDTRVLHTSDVGFSGFGQPIVSDDATRTASTSARATTSRRAPVAFPAPRR